LKNLLNKTELAEIFGVSRTTISDWIIKGMPVEDRGRNGKEWQFSLPQVAEWRLEQLLSNTPVSGVTITEAKRRRALAEAELKEFELKIKSGEYVHLESILELYEGMVMAIRAKLLAFPTKVATVVHGSKSLPVAHDILEKHIYEVLNELSAIDAAEIARQIEAKERNIK
jgi:phage terminase Nu1 subunit (DNA packaging protein)